MGNVEIATIGLYISLIHYEPLLFSIQRIFKLLRRNRCIGSLNWELPVNGLS